MFRLSTPNDITDEPSEEIPLSQLCQYNTLTIKHVTQEKVLKGGVLELITGPEIDPTRGL